MNKYFYFGKAANGAIMPLFECMADEDPTSSQTNAIYAELVKQQGLGVPRPTHFAKLELIEIEQTDEVENVTLITSRNLAEVVN